MEDLSDFQRKLIIRAHLIETFATKTAILFYLVYQEEEFLRL